MRGLAFLRIFSAYLCFGNELKHFLNICNVFTLLLGLDSLVQYKVRSRSSYSNLWYQTANKVLLQKVCRNLCRIPGTYVVTQLAIYTPAISTGLYRPLPSLYGDFARLKINMHNFCTFYAMFNNQHFVIDFSNLNFWQ